ncbi:1-phosphofructokinase [Actinopolyspora saharensis]|uniref:1-phosphofructokinase n=1 Tax=Actinopolyspora saharensis TaxID=995062 RepID=A0A1H0YEL5_9ACTN|nr:1-phosphofructokinase [Actinopolyspora saharensis]SDQ13572.1 1-phosphofructokinase [Actinopolyspora saharensis]
MIVTVTPNPSLDRSVALGRLERGAVHRSERSLLEPGGKGVNVARALAAADHGAVALLPTGGAEGSRLAELLAPESVSVVEVPIEGTTRTNLTLLEPDGTTTKINEPGSALNRGELEGLRSRLGELAARADWVVACGSLPAGCPEDLHAALVRTSRSAGTRVAVDASGGPLAEARWARPDLIAPNLSELAELVGRELSDLAEVVSAAREVRRDDVGAVLVTLGERGAVLVEARGCWHANSRARWVRSTVGAGDAALAGFLLAGADGPEALRHAVAYGTAGVELSGSRMPSPGDLRLESVRVTEVDETRHLDGVTL